MLSFKEKHLISKIVTDQPVNRQTVLKISCTHNTFIVLNEFLLLLSTTIKVDVQLQGQKRIIKINIHPSLTLKLTNSKRLVFAYKKGYTTF